MNATWRKLSDRYAALSRREQLMVAAATLAAVGFLLFTLWVKPATGSAVALHTQIDGQQTELVTLRTQIGSLKAQLGDPDAANRKALAELQARLAAVDHEIGNLNDKLVPPQQMGKVLQTVLARHHGLALASLRSLAPEPLLMLPGEKGAAEKATIVARENIYRHGLEIRLVGSYAELLAYATELERAPQRLFFGGMTLVAKNYPRSELTLTVYTLSRERDWLAV